MAFKDKNKQNGIFYKNPNIVNKNIDNGVQLYNFDQKYDNLNNTFGWKISWNSGKFILYSIKYTDTYNVSFMEIKTPMPNRKSIFYELNNLINVFYYSNK